MSGVNDPKGAQFEIKVDGVVRTHRDVRGTAIEAAHFLTMSHYHHWSMSRLKLMLIIRDGLQPGFCGCDICEQIYAECRRAAEKFLAEYDFKDFDEAERLKEFLSRPIFEIRVDGVVRGRQDERGTAIEAARSLKQRNPGATVVVTDLRDGTAVAFDRQP